MLPASLSLLAWFGPPLDPPEPDPAPAPVVEAVETVEVAPTQPGREHVPPPPLHVHLEVDLPLLIGAGGLWLGTELALAELVPPRPRWAGATRPELRAREAWLWRSPATARKLSDAFAYAVIPVMGLTATLVDVGLARQWRVVHEDLIVVLESVAVAAMLTQGIKLATARVRPYAYEAYQLPADAGPDALADRLVYEPDALMSFPSGHANLAFAFAASFATVATLRGRKSAPWLWGLGMPAASFVAYLRVAGHRHWVGDVVVGSTIGAVVGTGLPILLHHPDFGLLARMTARKQRARLSVAPTATGAVVFGEF